MELRAADPTPERGSDRDLGVVPPTRALAVFSELGADLMEPLGAEAQKLYLRHRHHPRQGKAEGRADDAGLGERSVDHPRDAEALHQPARRTKDTAQLAHVEPEHHHARVAFHLLGEGVVDRLDDVALRHLRLPVEQLSALPEDTLRQLFIDVVEEVTGTWERSGDSGLESRVDLVAQLLGQVGFAAMIPEAQTGQVFLDPLD